MASGSECGETGPLGRDFDPRRWIIEIRERRAGQFVIGPAFDANGSLSGRGKHHRRLENEADAVVPAESAETGFGEDNRVELAFIEFSKAGVEIAPDLAEPQVGALSEELGLATEASGSNACLFRKGVERRTLPPTGKQQCITARSSREHGSEDEPGRRLRRQILQAVDRNITASLKNSLLDLFGEDSDAAERREGGAAIAVSLSRYRDQFHAVDGGDRSQPLGDVLGLPGCQGTGPSGDSEWARRCAGCRH